jgi:hypothetical protein
MQMGMAVGMQMVVQEQPYHPQFHLHSQPPAQPVSSPHTHQQVLHVHDPFQVKVKVKVVAFSQFPDTATHAQMPPPSPTPMPAQVVMRDVAPSTTTMTVNGPSESLEPSVFSGMKWESGPSVQEVVCAAE